MITLLESPRRFVGGNPSRISKWNAIYNQVFLKFHRQDFTVTSVVADGTGKILAQLLIAPTGLAVDMYVYMKCGTYDGTFKVLAVAGNVITLDTPFTSNQSSGYMNSDNLRPSYRVEVNLYKVVGTSWVYFTTKLGTPDVIGITKIDVSTRLRSLVSIRNQSAYNVVNDRDPDAGGLWNYSFREYWTGSNESFTAFSQATQYYYVGAAKQLLDQYGSNMAEFVPFSTGSDFDARFLLPKLEPSYFPGYPFDVSFIYSEDLANWVITRKEQCLDLNTTPISTLSQVLDSSQSRAVNRLMLTAGPSLPAGTQYINLWLESGVASGSPYMGDQYVEDAYVVESVPSDPLPPPEL